MPDIDFKAILCYYEFSVLPPSLFSPDGSMHHCLAKSKLMGILEALPNNKEEMSSLLHTEQNVQATSKVAVVDGMAQPRCIVKPSSLKSCKELCLYFCKVIYDKFQSYDEVHLVFDSYLNGSLKTATREHRTSVTDQVQYKISPETNISNISMIKLLSHDKTKDELTHRMTLEFVEYGKKQNKHFVAS